jgi:cytochrome c peroxidase
MLRQAPRRTPIDARRAPASTLERTAHAVRPLAAIAALGIAILGDATPGTADPAQAAFTAIERERILSLGPWPAPASAQATADATAAPARVAFGERLFHSARLSGNGVRCASCHEPFRHFTDGRPRARGLRDGARNTPTLVDVAAHRVFGWDGARDRLDLQSLRPIRDPAEMAATPAHVATLVRGDADLRAGYAAAFGTSPPDDDEAVLAGVGRALASYEATITSARTPFDDWRDAFASGDDDATRLPPAARRGLRTFVGAGGCIACHSGPMLGDDRVHASTIRSLRPDGTPDPGRAGEPPNAFRTPALRGVAVTAPYMHDGSVARLCDAALPHASLPGAGVPPGGLTAAERDDVAAFLRTLSPAPSPMPDAPDDRACAAD